ncbi:crosslink repair DNA glycosylase YcaQ family protein [Asanoa sp. NPDC049573]|uniref:DNA glycosylase AlkZ-like family protein n=1 Tax=Asanoa sp. NPDC049573 TaxID=3155396 RepID=UPI00341517BC
MTVHRLSARDARRIAVRAQLLDRARPESMHDVVRHLTLLQADLTSAVAPNADLVLWSRLGSAYDPGELVDALDHHRLVELLGMIRPREDIALYRAEMAEWAGPDDPADWRQRRKEWVRANEACRREILARLDVDGPLPQSALPDTCAVPWGSSGWNNDRNRAMMLLSMALRGEIAAAGRDGREQLWDLATRIYPDDVTPAEDARRIRNERRLRALGIARARAAVTPNEPNDVGEAGEPAVVDGVRGGWRVDPAQLGQPFAGRAALLSPLDRLVFDRKRMVELFAFGYTLEMYKPAANRRWGYFALPILYGDRLVGKLDATADRKNHVLRVDAIHRDVPFTTAMTRAVDAEIRDLARWLGLALDVPD